MFTPVGLKARKCKKLRSVWNAPIAPAPVGSRAQVEKSEIGDDALLYASLSPLTWELHFKKLMKLNLATSIRKFRSAVETARAGAVAGENIDDAN